MAARSLPALLAGLLLLLAGCTPRPAPPDEVRFDQGLIQLGEMMTGSFSSAAQAERDSAYHDIRLQMVRIWPHRSDGIWLYVEQAAADKLDQPYRQRVYRLTREDETTFRSRVYAFRGDPLRFAGAWKEDQPLRAYMTDSLELREGCDIWLARVRETRFEGATRGKGCESTLAGANYATSVVIITPERLISWDRGFRENGEQAWGAAEGGYVFDKLANHPLRPDLVDEGPENDGTG
jgi:hypothetical protein